MNQSEPVRNDVQSKSKYKFQFSLDVQDQKH